MTDEQLTAAWDEMTNNHKLPAQIAKDIDVTPKELRVALIEKYGQQAFRSAIQSSRQNRIPDGSRMLQFVDNVLAKNVTPEQLDVLITNMQAAVQQLTDARNAM